MKEIVIKHLHHLRHINWSHGTDLSQIKEDIEYLLKEGATGIDIKSDDGAIYYTPYIEREETDKEYTKRLEKEAKEMEIKKQFDLKLLEELKNKYEK